MKRLSLIIILMLISCAKDEGASICIYEHILETNEPLNVLENSAFLSGSVNVISENCPIPSGTIQGFVYATNTQPNINDNLVISSGTQVNATLSGLSPNTTYYVRSFISSSIGEYYGNEISFTTEPYVSNIDYGLNEYVVEFQGIQREYIIYVPESYLPENPLPLVFVMHGFGGSNSGMISRGFNEIADEEDFIVVYPQGSDFLNLIPHWNVGGFTSGSTTNDVAFIDFLLTSISQIYTINSNRIFSTGMSNGGFMSFLLACQLSNKFAAIASVTGSMTTQTLNECNPVREVPILQIHGTNDTTVPYEGVLQWNTSIQDVLNYWVDNNQCSDEPEIYSLQDIDLNNNITVNEITYENGNNGSVVKHYKVIGGGHNWFQNDDIKSSELIWDFFSMYDLDGLIN